MNLSHLCPMAILLLFAIAPSIALAQTPSEDAPPPAPLYTRDDVPEEEETPRQLEERSVAQPDDSFSWPDITPSFSLMGHMGLLDPDFDLPGLGFWLGANYYPWPAKFNAFWSLGVKVENNSQLRDRPFAVVPTLRSGFAWIHGKPEKFLNQMFPNLQVYGLVGHHVPIKGMPSWWRAGIGVIAPRLVPANAMMLLLGVPLPNQLEVMMDFSGDFSERELLIGMGIGF